MCYKAALSSGMDEPLRQIAKVSAFKGGDMNPAVCEIEGGRPLE